MGAHACDARDVAAWVVVDPDRGLSADEAARRLELDGANELARPPRATWLQRVFREFLNPLVILLLVAVAVSLVAWILDDAEGLPYDALAIAAILLVNAGIGAVQAHRADNAAAALEQLSATHATVLRDGDTERVPTSGVVVGDVLVLAAGDAVAADARILSASSLRAAEAALTGESQPVDKGVAAVDETAFIGDRSSMLFSGTAVVEGHATAAVVATGMSTEVGRIASMLTETERLDTPLEQEISSLGRLLAAVVVAIAVIVIGVLLITSDVDSVNEVIDVLLVGVSLAVAAVPEGLPAVLSVVLAISVQRMAHRNALVRRLASAETLGSATVICTDKTGTLTRSEMTVRIAIVGSTRVDVGGVGYEPRGELTVRGGQLESAVRGGVELALRSAAWASDSDVEETADGWVAVGNPTEAAVVAASRKLDDEGPLAPRRVSELAFSSDRKRMSVLLDVAGPSHEVGPGGGDGVTGLLVSKGAPDVLIERCSTEWIDEGESDLTAKRRTWWSEQVQSLAAGGLRTLAVARRQGVVGPLSEDDENGLQWLGLLGIDDPPREEAAPAVRVARDSGIRVVMMTGDHPDTAARIASVVGIGTGDDVAATGRDIDAVDQDGLAELARQTSVFARVTPEHKLRLVRALQAHGEVVAMTGDGVNDAPALKAADLGVAMGRTGTDVAREASDVILLDDNFATIVTAVSEGRTIWHNIRSFLRYLLSSNAGEVLTVFLGIVLAGVIGLSGDGVLALLTASQILWINLLTDAAPALALGMDPADPELMRRPPRPRHERVVDGRMRRGVFLIGLTMAAVTLLMFDLQHTGGLIEGDGGLDDARSAAFTVLVLAQVFNSFSARSDTVSVFRTWAINPLLLWAALLAVVLQIAVVHLPPLNDAFATTPLSLADWLLSAALASVVLWVAEIRKLLLRRSRR